MPELKPLSEQIGVLRKEIMKSSLDDISRRIIDKKLSQICYILNVYYLYQNGHLEEEVSGLIGSVAVAAQSNPENTLDLAGVARFSIRLLAGLRGVNEGAKLGLGIVETTKKLFKADVQ